MPSKTGFRKAKAFFMAFVIQSIFGWSAFMIDYTTPTIGIGCRAFYCMVYSLTSTFSCLLLTVASQFSDSWLSQFDWSLRNQGTEEYEGWENPHETKFSDTRGVMAVCCRVLGKTLAILNALFIVVACFLEFAGVYESCFCKSCYFGLRGRAFVSFLSTEQSAHIARPFWYAGSGVAMLTVLLLCFGYFTKVHHDNKVNPSIY